MKLAGNIQVTHRLNPVTGASRPRWANLAIGKDPSSGELFLTCVSNISNSKYKILGNIEQVFMKFIQKGLATIRFREPAHDLSIDCKKNIDGLKSFLIALRQVLQNKPITVPLSALNPSARIIQKAKTSMKINERSVYPVLTGFPRSLEALSLNVQMERFDRRIISLVNLKSLNLSDNRISVLPKELGELPHLATLILSGNRLGQATDEESTWSWMESPCMSSNLRHLDLTANELQQLPASFDYFRSLVTLKLDGNGLTTLPQMIGTFVQLKHLSIGGNRLTHLPGSFSRLRLDYADISGNPFVEDKEPLPNEDAISSPPSLFEEAARTIVNQRLFYTKHLIPKMVQNYFKSAKICLCGSACFESRLTIGTTIDLNRVSPSVMIDENVFVSRVPAEMSFCSKKCFTLTWPTGVIFQNPDSVRLFAATQRMIQRRSNAQVARTLPSLPQGTDGGEIESWRSDLIHQYRRT